VPVEKKDATMLTGQQLARARDLEHGRGPDRLPRDAYDRFTALLDGLTLERESIKQAMGCALDNSECAVELVHLLRKRFHRDDASPVQLVAYLYVASDLLHNSSASVKNASLFRTTFQACLPEILDRLRRVHRQIQGRMSALAMRDKVLAVLTAWGSWSLFPPHYLVGLNATFLRKVEEADDEAMREDLSSHGLDEDKLRKACAQAGIVSSGSVPEMVARLQWLKEFTAPTSTTTTVKAKGKAEVPMKERVLQKDEAVKKENDKEDGEPMKEAAAQDDLDGEPLDEKYDDDVDGEPLDEKGDDDVDGEPLDPEEAVADDEDIDGEPMDPEDAVAEEDLDGEPLDDDEDVDGEPLDEDLDGEPL
jgi:U2-associated protein SR140